MLEEPAPSPFLLSSFSSLCPPCSLCEALFRRSPEESARTRQAERPPYKQAAATACFSPRLKSSRLTGLGRQPLNP